MSETAVQIGQAFNREMLADIPNGVSPVIDRAVNRAREDSTPGNRAPGDGRKLALVNEGGGNRGSINVGMLVVLDTLGLIPSFDVIYGTSAGALNGVYAAAGQTDVGATNYLDTLTPEFYNRRNRLRLQSALDPSFIHDEIIARRKPINFEALKTGPEFRAVATDVKDATPAVLGGFITETDDGRQIDENKVHLALRASSAQPPHAEPVEYEGKRLSDGGLVSAIAYKQAIADGATDVLVLRTRPVNYRKSREFTAAGLTLLKGELRLSRLLLGRSIRYNELAAELAHDPPENIFQIAPAEDVPKISRTEQSQTKLELGMNAGASAVAAALHLPEPALLWTPVPHVRLG